MATMKILKVFPQPRAWGDKYPDNCSVNVLFEDGSMGEVATKKDKAEEVKERLTALVGQDADFELDEGKEFQGEKRWGIKNYPGKPQGGGFGGGGGGRAYVPAYHQTKDGFMHEQKYMNARTAVMQAVALLGPGEGASRAKELSTLTKGIFKILQELVPEPVAAPAPAQPAAQSAPQGGVPNSEEDPFDSD